MKFSLIAIIGITILLGCKKDPGGFESSGNYSGLLDSIIRYQGDSGMTGARYDTYRFSYDAEKRIDKIQLTNTLGGKRFYLFFYTGQSKNPYLVVDSSFINGNSNAWLQKYHITYALNEKKIKDSLSRYFRDTITHQVTADPPVYSVRIFDRQTDKIIMTVQNNTGYFDTIFLNTGGDFTRTHSRYSFNLSSNKVNYYNYHTGDVSPISDLNISSASSRIIYFFETSFYPLSNVDLLEQKYLFKKIIGTNDQFYRCANGETTEINCYYSKNTSNKVNSIVLATYSIKPGNTCGMFYTNIKLFYHQ